MENNGNVILVAYLIMLREKNNTKKYLDLSQFGDANEDLYQIMKGYLESQRPQNGSNPKIFKEGNKKTIYFNSVQYNDQERTIKTRVDIGEFGTSYPIMDVNTGVTKYTTSKDDTTSTPINIFISIPKASNEKDLRRTHGIAVFEKFRNRAAKGLFQENFNKYFKPSHDNFIVEFEPYTPSYLLDYLKEDLKNNNSLTKVELKSMQIPSDLTDVFEGTNEHGRGPTISLELSGKGFTPSFRSKIGGILRHESSIRGILGDWFPTDQIAFNIEVEGERKRIVIKEDGETILPGIDITHLVSEDPLTGFPDQASIFKESEKHVKQIYEMMNKMEGLSP